MKQKAAAFLVFRSIQKYQLLKRPSLNYPLAVRVTPV